MDIEKIKSGRPKPVFVRVLEWVLLGTLTAVVLIFLGSLVFKPIASMLSLFEFLVMIEVGLLAGFYGAEGLKFGFIWLTYPSLAGPKRVGFSGILAIFISLLYVLMGVGFIVAAIMFAYMSGAP